MKPPSQLETFFLSLKAMSCCAYHMFMSFRMKVGKWDNICIAIVSHCKAIKKFNKYSNNVMSKRAAG